MFLNSNRTYLFFGCIVFFINVFPSYVGDHFMQTGIVNYQELNSELQKIEARFDKKLAEQCAQRTDVESLNSRLDGIILRLNEQARTSDGMMSRFGRVEKRLDEKVSVGYFDSIIDILSGRLAELEQKNAMLCKELEQKNVIFCTTIEALKKDNVESRRILQDCIDRTLGIIKTSEDRVQHNKAFEQQLMLLVLKLQERVGILEESLGRSNSLPVSRAVTPCPDQVQDLEKLEASPVVSDLSPVVSGLSTVESESSLPAARSVMPHSDQAQCLENLEGVPFLLGLSAAESEEFVRSLTMPKLPWRRVFN
jgi:hypothetical protein